MIALRPALAGLLLIATAFPGAVAAESGPLRSLRALLVPRSEAALSTQINAIIAEIPVRPGERFKKGDVLVRFDCRVQQGQLRKADAELAGARKTLEVKRQLAKLRSVSELDVGLAEAEAAKAEADVSVARAVLSLCVLNAPFDGRVVELQAHAHESYQAGQKLMDILDDGSLEIEVIVPSRWLAWLKPGTAVTIRIDETGKSYDAKLSKLGARVDPVSQSVKVYASLTKPAAELLAGMSGEASFPDQP